MREALAKTLLAAVLMLVGCNPGAREVDLAPQRPISADISASLNRGPTAIHPGMTSPGP